MPSVLNVGGGSKSVEIPTHYAGWEHLLLDIDPKRGVDLVCDARLLADRFPPSGYDAVYCSHNLEHYYRHDVDKVLKGFLHVLTDDGFAEIRVPDIGELIRLMAAADLDIEHQIYKAAVGGISAHDVIYGYGPEIEESGQDFYAHKTGFTRASLARALLANGFSEIYFAAPLAMLELRVFAFKQAAPRREKSRLSLDEKYLASAAPAPTDRQSITVADQALKNPAADPVDALYARAVTAWGAGLWAEAIDIAGQALRIDAKLPALHYLVGCSRMELGDTQAAARDFAACLALAPAYPLSGQALARRALSLAREDLRAGRQSADQPIARSDHRSISIILCSASAPRFEKTAAMYRRLLADVPHEIIAIHDARSLAEGYNRGLALAANEFVVFAHDDVEIASPDFAARLLSGLRHHDVLGIAGTDRIKGGAWHFAGHPHLHGQIAMPAATGLVVTLYGVTSVSCGKLLALDGLLLATRRDTALRIGFDAQTFDGWHLYDLDFTLRAARSGLDCAACSDILAVHASQGSYDQEWIRYSERFIAKHRLERGAGIFHQPELVSLPVRSVDEWRLMTEHLISFGAKVQES
jgi:tetratricopeptide (TPR) repeat protein